MADFVNINEVMKNDMLRDYFSAKPKKVDPTSTSFFYYKRALFRKAMSIYEFKGIPENWDYDYMLSTLLANGYYTSSPKNSLETMIEVLMLPSR